MPFLLFLFNERKMSTILILFMPTKTKPTRHLLMHKKLIAWMHNLLVLGAQATDLSTPDKSSSGLLPHKS